MALLRRFALLICVGGIVVSIVGVLGLALGWGSTPAHRVIAGSSRSATTSPTPLPSTPSQSATLSPSPSSSSSSVSLNSAIAFLDRLSKAIRAGDTGYLLSHLDPAVVARYGRAQCASVARQLKDPSLHLQLVQLSGPMTYNYHSDGLSALVPGVYVFKSTGMAAGTRGTHISHFASHNGDFLIFVDCGHPISSK